jgi:dTDP-glucose pyrophosphorylase
MTKKLESFLVGKELSVKQTMTKMNENGQKTVFVVDEKNRLIGSLSDGDIRKWILGGGSLSVKAIKLCNRKPKWVREGFELEEAKQIMLKHVIECVPVLNRSNEIIMVLTWEDAFSESQRKQREPLDIQVVIMAGGKGTRLDPFTRILPKPLIPIGDKPIIELIMDKFNEHGIREFFVSVNHKARMIRSYFEDSDGRYKIHYVEEKKPLGTVGGLRLMKHRLRDPFLITNCDVIIEADCAEIIKFHRENRHDMTLVVSCKHYIIPYGVCEIENGGILRHINEKPEYELLVNTGMYIMNKKVLNLIPKNHFFNINDLIAKVKSAGFRIGVFPIGEDSWIDIGQWEEYRKAVEKMRIEG